MEVLDSDSGWIFGWLSEDVGPGMGLMVVTSGLAVDSGSGDVDGSGEGSVEEPAGSGETEAMEKEKFR